MTNTSRGAALAAVACMVALLLWLGLNPQPLLSTFSPAMDGQTIAAGRKP